MQIREYLVPNVRFIQQIIEKQGSQKNASKLKQQYKTLRLGVLHENDVIGKAEKYYHSLIEASLDPLVTISPEGIIKDVNTATENATGLPREKLIGTVFSEYYTEPEMARTFCQNIFEDGKVYDYELDLNHIDGKITTFVYNAAIYKDDKGNVLGAFAAARDITASRKAEDELKYLKNNLELLVKQRTEELFVSNRELVFQSGEKADRAVELLIADKELTFQSAEKADRAAELIIADKELTFQSGEKDLFKGYDLGINAYVVKPVDFASFAEIVKEIGIFWAIINELPAGKG